MKNLILPILGIAVSPLFLANSSFAAGHALLKPGDTAYAFDLTYGGAAAWPGSEGPGNVLDGNSATKYLNFGRNWSGLIMTPGLSTVQSLRFTTANDATDRDPTRYQLYGTMDPITSAAGGQGRSENWTLIGGGNLNLPTARFDSSTVVDIPNGASYTSYKLLFPGVRNDGTANSMQIADVQMYSGPAGGGSSILSAGQPTVAVDDNGDRASESRYPGAESPAKGIDGLLSTKYLNFGKDNSGLIVVPGTKETMVSGFELWTANDAPERDPAAYAIYGHSGSIQYGDNSLGDLDSWTLISSGNLSLPLDRLTSGGLVEFNNDLYFDAYRFVVTSVRDGGAANSMQFADLQLYGVPEPSSIAMSVVTIGFAGWLVRRRCRK